MKELLGLGCLYLLASPVYALRWLLARLVALPQALARGVMTCPWCEEPVPLARMNSCPTCGFTSPSSLIAPCEHCGDGPFPFTQCPSCGGNVKVL